MQNRILLVALVAALVDDRCGRHRCRPKDAGRPKITGISHLAVYTSDATATEHFYTVSVGAVKATDPENPRRACATC